jgi:flavin-dependent dehydrogenase
VLVTLASLVPGGRRSRFRWYIEALAQTNMIRRALNGSPLPQEVSVTNARACVARSGVGDHWLAIGDARIAPDPLSGQGLIWAIDDAIMAMDLFTRLTWQGLAERMRARTLGDLKTYLEQRSRIYAVERRFGRDAYWASVRDEAESQPDLMQPLFDGSLRRNERWCRPKS